METLYVQLIWAGFIVGSIIVGGKVIFNSEYFKKKATAKIVEAKGKNPTKQGVIAQARDLIETAPQKLAQIDKELDHLQKTGANDAQMANLKMERQIVELANNPIAKMFGEPIIDLAVQAAKKVGLNLK